MSQSDLDELLNYTLQEMAKVAKENGTITYQEFEIMRQVRYDVSEYQNALAKALDDGIITSEEKHTLAKMKDDILQNVVTVANFDKVVDDEEKGLIVKITQIVNEYLAEMEDKGSKA
ncbi:MAG: hypothetical protein GPJ54_18445 [Candidatus Heimdallarchaeota archaeon]|nr:hypothetical protein [Candidatus Heimdallarchaeota archaeon]